MPRDERRWLQHGIEIEPSGSKIDPMCSKIVPSGSKINPMCSRTAPSGTINDPFSFQKLLFALPEIIEGVRAETMEILLPEITMMYMFRWGIHPMPSRTIPPILHFAPQPSTHSHRFLRKKKHQTT